MLSQSFFLLGEAVDLAQTLSVHEETSFEALQGLIASHFAIAVPGGIGFVCENNTLTEIHDILASESAVGITIDGSKVREIPGPKGQPYVGNYFEVYPDHLGNHQRLFEKYGPVIKTTNFGGRLYHTNDPEIAAIAFEESDFFTKDINPAHPLHGIKNASAGIFLGDTNTPEWRQAHRFLPPALGPKAVRHYAPSMQRTIEQTYDVFDELDQTDQSWNVYIYMMKLSSQAVTQLVLGLDIQHFASVDARIHEIIQLIAESLHLNKKVTSYGSWYAMLPFGDPKLLRQKQQRLSSLVDEQVQKAKSSGIEDLPLQEAALKAANMVDYAVRATDSDGKKLPKEQLIWALIVATGAGFTTTSSLLSWLIYGMVTYPGVQAKLLQELVDNDFSDDVEITSDFTDRLVYLDRFIKETQRRHNPSFLPARTAKVDLILPGGYKLPKGSVLVVALHHIHNNPAHWDSPAVFDPERWGTPQVKNRHKAAYIPFATGPRMCFGFHFALQEAKMVVCKLLWRYKFFKDGTEIVDYDPMFQLIRPVNLYVRAKRRVKWPPKTEMKTEMETETETETGR